MYAAANQLKKDGFFSDKTVQWYIEDAKTADLNPKPVEREQPAGGGFR